MKTGIELSVNGVDLKTDIEPNTLLLDLLRLEIGLTGTKEGCGEGMCGACTVLVDGAPVRSCLVLALQVKDRSITTIEGIGSETELHPLQSEFLKKGAVQCGFCSPGLIVTAKAFLDANPKPTEDEIRDAIRGNFCRCTGYVKIVDAIQSAATAMRG